MLRKIVNGLIVLPIAVIFVVFAVANRHLVSVSFDPFDAADPSIGFRLPLFVVILLTAVFGVVAGGVAVWLRQSHWRRAARRHEADARDARARFAELRAQTTPQGVGGSPYPQRAPMPERDVARLTFQ